MFPHELEDTFGDVVRKASRGTKTSVDTLASETGIAAGRLSDFIGDKAEPSETEALAIADVLQLDPQKLVDSRLHHWLPERRELPAFAVQQINAPQPSNGYFIVSRDRKVGAFVDPAGRPESIIEGFRRLGIEPQYFLCTHKHLDHTDALAAVRKAFPKAKAVIHHLDAPAVGDAASGAIDIEDSASLPFGDGEIRMLYTPGHTDGSCCFLYEGTVFTGDTLFASSVGALFGERFGYDTLLKSVREKLFALPQATVVFPGHGPSTTIAQELAHNPFFLS